MRSTYDTSSNESDEDEFRSFTSVIVHSTNADNTEKHLIVVQLCFHFRQTARTLATENDITSLPVGQQNPIDASNTRVDMKKNGLPVRVRCIVSNLLPGLLNIWITQID